MPKDLEVMIAVREVDGNSDNNGLEFSGDGSIRTRTATKQYRDGWDAIFGKVTVEDETTDGVKTEKTDQPKPIDKNVN